MGAPATGLAWKGGRWDGTSRVSGTILEVNASGRSIVIRDRQGAIHTFRIGPKTVIEMEREVSRGVLTVREGAFGDLIPGAWVRVRMSEGENSTAKEVVLLSGLEAGPPDGGR